MFRASLRSLCERENLFIPDKFAELRPEQLRPEQFIELTAALYGERTPESMAPLVRNPAHDAAGGVPVGSINKEAYGSTAIWRKAMFPNMTMSNKQKAKLERRGELTEDGELNFTEIFDEDDEEVPQWKKDRNARRAKRIQRESSE